MLSVDDALNIILADAAPSKSEEISLGQAHGRVLAQDVYARTAQPPFDSSAMDGYAVHVADAKQQGARLAVTGEARAGAIGALPELRLGAAVRIYTGGVVPKGADHVIIQEHVSREGDFIIVDVAQSQATNIRFRGVDFGKDELLNPAGSALGPIDLALLAAANVDRVKVWSKPVVAYFDNGDELTEPGSDLRPGQIVGSNRFALDGLIRQWGGEPRYLGRAGDAPEFILDKFAAARGADCLVTIGGASVGDYDYMREAFSKAGGRLIFEKIAVKPGKPTWCGWLGSMKVLGLPGNPASAIVCSMVFLRPLIYLISGRRRDAQSFFAVLSAPLPANGSREAYLRARLSVDEKARLCAAPLAEQDSSILSSLSSANALIRRRRDAPAAQAGELTECIPIQDIVA